MPTDYSSETRYIDYLMRLSVKVALTSVLAALFLVLKLIPLGFPVIGVEGAVINISQAVVIALSLLFPPWISVPSVAIGEAVASTLNPRPPFHILGFIPATMGAAAASLYRYGWRTPLAIYIPLLILYMAYPPVGPLWTYPLHPWFHIIGLIIYIATNISLPRYGWLSTTLLAALAGQAGGTLLFMLLYYPVIIPEAESFTGIWIATALIYPVERILMALAATAIYLALARALASASPEIRPYLFLRSDIASSRVETSTTSTE